MQRPGTPRNPDTSTRRSGQALPLSSTAAAERPTTADDYDAGTPLTAADYDAGTPIQAAGTPGLLADFTQGVAKGTGRMVLDTNKLLGSLGPRQQPNPAIEAILRERGLTPAGLLTGAEQAVRPSNLTQTIGSFVPDVVAAAAMPEIRGGDLVRQVATGLERSAIPGLTSEGANLALKARGGLINEANAARWAQTATRPSGLPAAMKWTPSAAVQNVAQSMGTAIKQPTSPLWQDALAALGGNYLGGPKLGAAAAALKFFSRPTVKSAVARELYTAAPVLQPTALGVVGGAVGQQQASDADMPANIRAAILQRLFGGSPE